MLSDETSMRLLQPALFLETLLELIGNLLGCLFGSPFDLAFTALLIVDLHSGTDNEPSWIVRRDQGCQSHGTARSLIALGIQ